MTTKVYRGDQTKTDGLYVFNIRDLAYSNRALVNRQDQSSVSETVKD